MLPELIRVSFAGIDRLPDVILDTSAGPVNTALRERGLQTTGQVARWLLELPYGHNRRRDATAVFDEGQGTCVTKHATYLSATAELGLDLRWRWGFYGITDDIVSGTGLLLAGRGLPFVPTIHCFIGHGVLNVDLTEGNCTGKNGQITEYLQIVDVGLGTDEAPLRAALIETLCAEDSRFAHVTPDEVADTVEACAAIIGDACRRTGTAPRP